jgi:hypothetical protein
MGGYLCLKPKDEKKTEVTANHDIKHYNLLLKRYEIERLEDEGEGAKRGAKRGAKTIAES